MARHGGDRLVRANAGRWPSSASSGPAIEDVAAGPLPANSEVLRAMITLQSHGARGAPLQQVVFALVACQLRCRFEWGARFRVAAESNGRPDESCPDPADILVGIAVLETPLLIKSLMSQTQGERIGNDQQSVGS